MDKIGIREDKLKKFKGWGVGVSGFVKKNGGDQKKTWSSNVQTKGQKKAMEKESKKKRPINPKNKNRLCTTPTGERGHDKSIPGERRIRLGRKIRGRLGSKKKKNEGAKKRGGSNNGFLGWSVKPR